MALRPPAARPRQRLDAIQVASLGAVVLGAVQLLRELGLPIGGAFVWPAVLAIVGVTTIWRQLDDDAEDRLRRMAARIPGQPFETLVASPTSWLRIGLGALLVLAGMAAFLAAADALPALRQGVLAGSAVVGGLVLVFGPWWWRLVHDLSEERRRRIRSDERAAVAAHLHDSVLQSLALIQRNAQDPAAVARVARRQERELRAWLFEGSRLAGDSLAAALSGAAAEVEGDYDVRVDVVTVGNAPVDPAGEAVVRALREAILNAAKHSGAAEVSAYLEVDPRRISGFVRDRGRGFDPATVPEGRGGLAHSVQERIERHGGRATVRSRPGEGTEVEVEVPRR